MTSPGNPRSRDTTKARAAAMRKRKLSKADRLAAELAELVLDPDLGGPAFAALIGRLPADDIDFWCEHVRVVRELVA